MKKAAGHQALGGAEMAEVMVRDFMRERKSYRRIRSAALDKAPSNVNICPGRVKASGGDIHSTSPTIGGKGARTWLRAAIARATRSWEKSRSCSANASSRIE